MEKMKQIAEELRQERMRLIQIRMELDMSFHDTFPQSHGLSPDVIQKLKKDYDKRRKAIEDRFFALPMCAKQKSLDAATLSLWLLDTISVKENGFCAMITSNEMGLILEFLKDVDPILTEKCLSTEVVYTVIPVYYWQKMDSRHAKEWRQDQVMHQEKISLGGYFRVNEAELKNEMFSKGFSTLEFEESGMHELTPGETTKIYAEKDVYLVTLGGNPQFQLEDSVIASTVGLSTGSSLTGKEARTAWESPFAKKA